MVDWCGGQVRTLCMEEGLWQQQQQQPARVLLGAAGRARQRRPQRRTGLVLRGGVVLVVVRGGRGGGPVVGLRMCVGVMWGGVRRGDAHAPAAAAAGKTARPLPTRPRPVMHATRRHVPRGGGGAGRGAGGRAAATTGAVGWGDGDDGMMEGWNGWVSACVPTEGFRFHGPLRAVSVTCLCIGITPRCPTPKSPHGGWVDGRTTSWGGEAFETARLGRSC